MLNFYSAGNCGAAAAAAAAAATSFNTAAAAAGGNTGSAAAAPAGGGDATAAAAAAAAGGGGAPGAAAAGKPRPYNGDSRSTRMYAIVCAVQEFAAAMAVVVIILQTGWEKIQDLTTL